jgi:hypothetical protein
VNIREKNGKNEQILRLSFAKCRVRKALQTDHGSYVPGTIDYETNPAASSTLLSNDQPAPPLAFVGLLLAVAEAARYGQGGQRLRRVTIIVFKRDDDTPPEVDQVVVRRALALIGSRD